MKRKVSEAEPDRLAKQLDSLKKEEGSASFANRGAR
jgi:hypothetical protein